MMNNFLDCKHLEENLNICVENNLSFEQYFGIDQSLRNNTLQRRNLLDNNNDIDDFNKILTSILPKNKIDEFNNIKNIINNLFMKANDYIINQLKSEEDLAYFSINTCKKNCNSFYEEYRMILDDEGNPFNTETLNMIYEAMNLTPVDDKFYLNICESVCYSISEIKEITENDKKYKRYNEYDFFDTPTENENTEKLSKREFKCSKQYNNIRIKGKDRYGILYFTDVDKFESALLNSKRVDGFSFDTLKPVFNPAGYGHDACYHCKDRGDCDDELLSNMLALCSANYMPQYYLFDITKCSAEALVSYAGVRLASKAKNSYKDDQRYRIENMYKATTNRGDFCICEHFDSHNLVSRLYLILPWSDFSKLKI